MISQTTYHLQVHEKGVFQHDEFVYNPDRIKESYDLLAKYKKEIIVTEICGHSEKAVSPEELEKLLASF